MVLYKGEDWAWYGTCTDDDTGLRTDLTGKTVELEIRYRANTNPIITLAIGSGATLRDQGVAATKGQVDFVILGAASANLATGNHRLVVKVDGEVVLPTVKLPVRLV